MGITFFSYDDCCCLHITFPDSDVGWPNVDPTSVLSSRRWANVSPTFIAVWVSRCSDVPDRNLVSTFYIINKNMVPLNTGLTLRKGYFEISCEQKSYRCVFKCLIVDNSDLVHDMSWCQADTKPLYVSMMPKWIAHISVIEFQWLNPVFNSADFVQVLLYQATPSTKTRLYSGDTLLSDILVSC